MAPNPIDYKVWANVDGTQRGEEGDVSKEKERGGVDPHMPYIPKIL